MPRKDLKNNLSVASTIEPAGHTATATGTAVDLLGYQSALVVISTGTFGASTDFGFEVQESDASGSGFAAVASDDLIGTEPTGVQATGDLDNTVYRIGYIGTKRYIRVVATKGSGSNACPFGVNVVRGHPLDAPVA